MPEPEKFLSEYLDRLALAKCWQVSWRTIARYEALPNGLPSIMLGGKKRYAWKDAIAWLESRKTRPNQRRAA